jgi:hypothetical protein
LTGGDIFGGCRERLPYRPKAMEFAQPTGEAGEALGIRDDVTTASGPKGQRFHDTRMSTPAVLRSRERLARWAEEELKW